MMRYKVNGSAAMTELRIGASPQRLQPLRGEPA
jgi:hypothetical protein